MILFNVSPVVRSSPRVRGVHSVSFACWVALFAGHCAVGCNQDKSAEKPDDRQLSYRELLSADEVVTTLGRIDPWVSGYRDQASWDRITSAAKRLNATEPHIVRSGIERFILGSSAKADHHQEWSRVFLVLRVMFELPSEAPPSDAKFFGGWLIPWRIRAAADNVNLGWPIEWSDAGPALVDEYRGYNGPPYLGWLEYDYYLDHYQFRFAAEKRDKSEQ